MCYPVVVGGYGNEMGNSGNTSYLLKNRQKRCKTYLFCSKIDEKDVILIFFFKKIGKKISFQAKFQPHSTKPARLGTLCAIKKA